MKKYLLAVFVTLTVHSHAAMGETTDFGGWSERMKGRGDQIPPRCQIDVPRTASSSFFVTWYCPDEETLEQNVRTELWIYRKNALAGELVKTFLGFPAAVKIDEGLLQVTKFVDGLPVGIRLTSTDQAGNTTMSPTLTVLAKSDSVNQCSLSVTQAASEATDSSSGTPESSVTAENVLVRTVATSDTSFRILSIDAAKADPCEIDSICSSENKVEFSSEVVVGEGSSATGRITVVPGELAVINASGTATITDNVLKSIELSGTSEFEDRTTSVSINCNQ